MSGIMILIALVLGVALAIGVWIYAKESRTQPGRVKPEAPPSEEEERRAEGE